ncbi:acetylornithine transaminase [Bacillus canaveralius]|uniref:acetylornithine transaminase n=1 Tax=Bacillus canaveralius TaxID=1403243 RepID=UPI000F78AFF9|nr:acetylornithine transaminase [Bacillus canaveralius]RSK56020.1 acetylornithine transaminase [Bacillus canaveralius]
MSYLFPTYTKWEVEPASAAGTILIDKNGKRYLDFTSGIGVCNLGHRPKPVEDAIQKQLDQYWHLSNLFVIDKQEAAAKMLADAAGLDLVFFANSGAEANEAAIKLARKQTGKHKIITFKNSFHGRTFATMAATGQEKVKVGFGPMLETFVTIPFNDIAALEKEMSDDTAAVMLEVIQGEGGIITAEEQFLAKVAHLCKQHQAMLIIDEIQTGIGRTGKPFAFQHFGLKPDIVTTAKGLGSGLPIGAVIGKGNLSSAFGPGSHGSTFGGNPLSVAAATATMEVVFQDSFLAEVKEKGEYLAKACSALLSLPQVIEIRGLGMMLGIGLSVNVQDTLATLRKAGLLALPAGENVLRLLPPLTVTEQEINEAVAMIQNTLTNQSLTAVQG